GCLAGDMMARSIATRGATPSRRSRMSMNPSSDITRLQQAVTQTMAEHWKMFLTEGILLVCRGVLPILTPPIATLAVTILVGWLFLISGVMGLIMTFMTRGAPGFWWSLISAIIGIAAGLVLLIRPAEGTLTLTVLLVAFFVIEGVV